MESRERKTKIGERKGGEERERERDILKRDRKRVERERERRREGANYIILKIYEITL